MVSLNPTTVRAFQEELQKEAAAVDALRTAGSYLSRQAGTAGAGMGAGGLLGAGVGTGIGAVRGYQEAKAQGASGGQAALSALGKGVHGGLTGTAVGAGLGGVAGLAGGEAATGMAKKLVAGKNSLAGAARFGERQVHSLTGAVPSGYASRGEAMGAMQAGAYPARERLDAAKKGLEAAWTGDGKPGALHKAVKEHVGAAKHLEVAQKAEDMGLTSVPGYLKSLATNPVDTLKTGLKEQWHSGGLGSKAIMFGLPAADMASQLGKADDPQGQGRGRFERFGRAAGQMALGAAPIPLAGQLALGVGAGSLGGLVGAGVDRKLDRKKAAQGQGQPLPILTHEEESVGGAPVEKHYTNAALGRPPEGLGA